MVRLIGARTPRVATADPAEVERQAEAWQDGILECRTYGHHWQPMRATYNARDRFYKIVQRCPRCTCERHAELGQRGQLFAQWYVYPDGYLSKGLGRITGEGRDVLRLATIMRTFDLEKLSARSNAAKAAEPRSKATREALAAETAPAPSNVHQISKGA